MNVNPFAIHVGEILAVSTIYNCVRFQVLTAASMKFRIVFSSLTMEAARTSET
jgi:hypothetical protein